MAMNEAQKQLMRAMIEIVDNKILPFSDVAERVGTMWTVLDMGTLTDADFSVDSEFSHISATDATSAKNAFDVIKTALGNYETGTPSRSCARISLRVR